MYKVHGDTENFQSLYLDNENYLESLHPHVSEVEAMGLGFSEMKVAEFWKPQKILVYLNEGTVSIPDISIWRTGLLLMNEKAFNALHDILGPYGEFLPCTMLGAVGYAFHCTTIHVFTDDEAKYSMLDDIYAEVTALEFKPPRVEDIVTGLNHVTFDSFFSDRLVNRIHEFGLKGLLFSRNLADQFPEDC